MTAALVDRLHVGVGENVGVGVGEHVRVGVLVRMCMRVLRCVSWVS